MSSQTHKDAGATALSEKEMENNARASTEAEPTPVAKVEPGEVTDSATEDGKEWEYVTGFKFALAMSAVTLCVFLMLLDTAIIATAIPRITSDFSSLDDVGWYGSAYLLSSAALQPMTGKLYSQFRTKFTYIAFLTLFELGSALCGAAQNSTMLIIGRAVAGLGGSGLVNGSLTIVSACVPLQKRATYIGILMACSQMGILLGPVLGGALTEHASWRWCFYINLPVGGVAAALLFVIHIPDRTAESAVKGGYRVILDSLDIPGFFLFAPTAIMFLLALEWGSSQKYAWDSATVLGLFCGSFGLLLVFIAWEHKRGPTAMIPLKMLANRIVWTSCIYIFFFFGALMTVAYYLAIWFQAVKGYSPTLSGVYILPSILPQMVTAVISGIAVGKLGYYLPWAVFSGAVASIGAGLLSSFTPTSSTAQWVGYQIIIGIGRGAGFQMSIVAVQNALPESQSPIALAILVFFQTFAGALFLAFDQTAFSLGLNSALAKYAPEVSPLTVVTAGASKFREIIPAAQIHGVVMAYNEALQHVFYIATGASVVIFLVSWGMGWKDIRKKEKKPVGVAGAVVGEKKEGDNAV